MPRRPSAFRRRLPFRLEIALRFQTDQQRIERARFHTGEPNQFIAVRPLATSIEENGKDRKSYGGKAVGEKGEAEIGKYDSYDVLLTEIVNFFRSGKPPVCAGLTA